MTLGASLLTSYAAVRDPADLPYEAQHGPIRTEVAPAYSMRRPRVVWNKGKLISRREAERLRQDAAKLTGTSYAKAGVLMQRPYWRGLSRSTIVDVLTRMSWVSG